MGSWIAVLVIAVVVIVVALAALAGVVLGRRDAVAAEPTPARPPAPPAAPMNDLESALARVTDRDGRPIRERIDAESAHVDPLRDPDDTGPLLRRALDSVVHHDDALHDDALHDDALPDDAVHGDPGAADDARTGGEPPTR